MDYETGIAVASRGEEYHHFGLSVLPITQSTMKDVDFAISRGCQSGFTVLALEQTKPKGSGTRTYQSRLGNVMFSRALAVGAHEYGQEFEILAAFAVALVLREMLPGKKIQLKYPNDVWIDGKKLCGCLVEPRDDQKYGFARMITLGVGVNLAVTPQGINATCLADHDVNISIAGFMLKFDHEFREIVNQYRCHKSFNIMLGEMGFLDEKKQMILIEKENGSAVCGTYQGFVIVPRGEEAFDTFIKLGKDSYNVREYNAIVSMPCRDCLPPHLGISPHVPTG